MSEQTGVFTFGWRNLSGGMETGQRSQAERCQKNADVEERTGISGGAFD